MNDITNHHERNDGCQFEEVRCLNNCGSCVQRQYLTKHNKNDCPYRLVNCQYCHITGKYQFIDNQHKKECPKFPVPCPNKCSMSIPRQDVDEHRKVCPCQVMGCPNMCGIFFQQKDKSIHVTEECSRCRVHCPYCKTILEYRMAKRHFLRQCPKYPLCCPNKCSEDSIPREDIDKHRQDCPLETVSCSNGSVWKGHTAATSD